MKKTSLLLILTLLFSSCSQKNTKMDDKIYQFKVTDLYGDAFDFNSLKGKKILIVNTASKCGYTYQYEKLQAVYSKYKDSGFVVVGFPANNFLFQEPGSNSEIAEFCKKNYGVTFPMMTKISVKGIDIHPVYTFLTKKENNGVMDSDVAWNFQKYAINTDGTLAQVFSHKTEPDDPVIIRWIEK